MAKAFILKENDFPLGHTLDGIPIDHGKNKGLKPKTSIPYGATVNTVTKSEPKKWLPYKDEDE